MDDAQVNAALDALVPDPADRHGLSRVELLALAARRAWQIRLTNTVNGGAVIACLHHVHDQSWNDIRDSTGIPRTTARRWSEAPPE